MVYLIHLETDRHKVQHCIAILTHDAGETLNIYYIQPHSRLMASLLALGVEWTVVRLWNNSPWNKLWPLTWHTPLRICPVCGVKC
jgi:hypothetical protein